MFKCDVYFRNIKVINYFKLEKVYKLRSWLWYHTQFKHKNNQTASTDFAE